MKYFSHTTGSFSLNSCYRKRNILTPMYHPGFKITAPYGLHPTIFFLKCHLNCCICRENRTFGILRKRFLKGTGERNSFIKCQIFYRAEQKKFSALEEDREQGQGQIVRKITQKYHLSALCACQLMVGRGDCGLGLEQGGW